jgi:hypothetical protein
MNLFINTKGLIDDMQVVVVGQPGRKRESLLTMLESIKIADPIMTVDSCEQVAVEIDQHVPSTILVDYRYPDAGLDKEIGDLVMNNAVNHVVLLQRHNSPRSHFTHYSTSEVVFDDLSVGILSSLLSNIQERNREG